MELERIEFRDISEFACTRPGSEYQRALEGETRKSMKQRVQYLSDGTEIRHLFWGLAFVCGMFTAVTKIFTWHEDNLTLLIFGCCIFLLAGLGVELEAWRNRRWKHELASLSGRTQHEEEIVSNEFQRACYRVWDAACHITKAIERWNAYVERVELGTTERFEGDQQVFQDILAHLTHVKSMDRLAHRLYQDAAQLVWEHRLDRKVTSTIPSLATLTVALGRLNLKRIDTMATWHKQLVDRHADLTPA